MPESTDPPGMPDGERMSPAEFRVVREFLGLTGDWLANHLDVNPRTVRHWEQGKYQVPDGVRIAMKLLEHETAAFVGVCVEKLLDLPDPCIVVYRNDAEYRAVSPEISRPASWHRAVVARIALEVPGLRITFQTQKT